MMNVPYYQPQVQSFSTPTYTIPPVQAQQMPQAAQIQQYPSQSYTIPQAQPTQVSQIPQVDNSRISAQFEAEILAETAALVELSKCAVNVEKNIQQTQDPQKKARLQSHVQDLNQLIAQREQKIEQLKMQNKQYEV